MRKSAIVVLSVLLGTEAVSVAGAPPATGPMSPMDPPLLGRAASGAPSALSTVWNGKELFSVWSDRRDPQQTNGKSGCACHIGGSTDGQGGIGQDVS